MRSLYRDDFKSKSKLKFLKKGKQKQKDQTKGKLSVCRNTHVLFSCVSVYKHMRERQGNLFLLMVDSSVCSGIFWLHLS